MDKHKIELDSDLENKNIKIKGLSEDDIMLNYSDDVDLTPVIRRLSECVDGGLEVSYSKMDETDDSKLNLILDTLYSIFDKYNTKINLTDLELQREYSELTES